MNDTRAQTVNGQSSIDATQGSRHQTNDRRAGLVKCACVTSAIIIATSLCLYLVFGYTFPPPDRHLHVLYVLLGLNLFFQRYHKAYSSAAVSNSTGFVKKKTLAWVFTFLFATLIVALTELKTVPRQLLFSVVLVSYIADILVSWMGYMHQPAAPAKDMDQHVEPGQGKDAISYAKAGVGLLILVVSFGLATAVKSGGITLYAHAEQITVILLASWLLAASLTRSYLAKPHNNIYYRIAPALKLGVVTSLLASMLYLYGGLDHVSRGVLFGTIGIFTLLQFIVDLSWGAVNARVSSAQAGDVSSLITAPEPAYLKTTQADASTGFQLEEHLPGQVVVDGRQQLGALLNRNLPRAEGRNVSILFSTEEEDVNSLEPDRRILINLYGLNFIENINGYLTNCYKKIPECGYLIVWFYPLDTIAQRLRAKMPRSLYVVLYPLHFLWFRVMPKLPVLDNIYFYVTKGKRSNISKAEVFGRLAYNGFSVVDAGDIKGKMYVVARADRTPLTGVEPSFGPIARLPRIGLNGEEVAIYKIRTMHPYSEFIQKDIFDCQGLNASGKCMQDFRVTSWGKVLRKYWIDELPQLYNWLRGDVGLVGVRALSHHYFSLYPRTMQELRIQHRPGLVPPLYADMARSFPEIIESERRYLLARSSQPALVDTKYFFRAIYNILFKGARSS